MWEEVSSFSAPEKCEKGIKGIVRMEELFSFITHAKHWTFMKDMVR